MSLRTSSESVWERLREGSEFFAKRGKVHTTLKRLAQRLDEAGLPYAVIGGMALNLHGYEHVTVNLNILMTPAGFELFASKYGDGEYVPAGKPRSFADSVSGVSIQFELTGQYPGDGTPKAVVYPDPAITSVERDGYRVIALEKLIDLKLASGLSLSYRLRDLADVQELIIHLNLPPELREQLDESVRAEYTRLWESAQGPMQSHP